jgi:hypothetical protein
MDMHASKTVGTGLYKSLVHSWFYEHKNPLIGLRGPLSHIGLAHRGSSLLSHNAGSATTQSKAFIYMMASEPYRYTWYLKQFLAGLPYIKIYFFKTLIAFKVK